jgi:spore germination protein YaaH
VGLVDGHGYDGINIDFESGAEADRDELTSFVASLASALHARGKKITVEVSAKSSATQTGRPAFYDYPGLGAVADWVFVMNWGKHWSTSTPGAMDDLPWATGVADYTATMPNKGKYVLGFPLYGMDWAAGGGAANPGEPLEWSGLQNLLATTGAHPVRDTAVDSWTFSYTDGQGVAHEVYYGDATTFATRIRLARNRGLQVGVWRLGEEDPRVWNDPLLG